MSENSQETMTGGETPVKKEMTAAERRARKKLEKQRKEESKSTARVVFEYIRVIAIGALIAFLLCKFVIINAEVPTGSMIPTISRGDRMIGLRLAYTFSTPKRGMWLFLNAPSQGRTIISFLSSEL